MRRSRIYSALQESILPSQNIGLAPPLRYAILPESTHLSRIYPFLRHYMRTPIFYPSIPEYIQPVNIYMRHSQNPPSNPKYTVILNIYMRPYHKPPLLFRIYIPSLAPRIYPIFTEYTPPFLELYATLRESIPPSHNLPRTPNIPPTPLNMQHTLNSFIPPSSPPRATLP